ncbi:MAG: HDOD domain-containing protein [Planctomycetaceae bacterium]|nr:HDOD domain-containing protein [Planctomycetaceae bacterium]
MTDNSFESLVQRIKKERVFALPQSAANIMELAKNPENGPAEFAVPISADPGLASQILSFANSSYFGFRHKITTIQQALSLISIRAMRNFVIWNAVFAVLPNPKKGSSFQLKIILQDAVRRGTFCKLLAAHFPGIDPDEVFIAGLIQDISLPVLVNYFSNEYEKLFQNQNQTGKRLSTLETEYFGWHHGQIGAFLVDEWGINNGLTGAVEAHSNCKDINLSEPAANLSSAIVKLSSLLPSAIDTIWNEAEADAFLEIIHKITVKKFLNGKSALRVSDLFAAADAGTAELLGQVRTSTPVSSLIDMLQQYSNMISDSSTEP